MIRPSDSAVGRARELLTGAWDTHVHVAPGLFPRWGDAWDLTAACTAAGLRGVVLKAHHGTTVEVAARLGREQSGLRVLGGVALNGFVGGLNPLAVEICLQLGGRVVWLPTVHARNHGSIFGSLGGFSGQATAPRGLPPEGLSVLDEGGELSRPVEEILQLLHQSGAVLATGHLSPDEIFSLRRYIEEHRIALRLLVNHALFVVPSLSAAQVRQLAAPWVYFETCYYTISPLAHPPLAPKVVARILGETAEAGWIVASDTGQAANPPGPEALALYGAALLDEGLAPEVLAKMLRHAPEELFAP
jgi:hypothetical protein